ncbi:hypothetical protein ACLIN3_27430 (plasmid) [Pseudomonas orientalis]|uniref:hypothetical protein n=1 Tax=Pseudomonas orientalis TaxID=76758 RepID=UPI0039879406
MLKPKIGAWATRIVGYLLVATTALLISSIAQELLSGSTLSTNKWGPRTVYTLAGEPFKYWASVVSHGVTALILGAAAAGAFWLARLESTDAVPTHKPRRR